MKYLYYILRLFFTPKCNHKFTIIGRGDITNTIGTIGAYYTLQCDKCGDVERRNLEV